MTKDNLKYSAFIDILKEELVPAMGCTEPIALAYGAAKAREVLGTMPEKVSLVPAAALLRMLRVLSFPIPII